MDTNSIISNDYLERVKVNYTSLLLDSKNPRFYGEDINRDLIDNFNIDDPRVQEYLRQTIYSKYNVQELVSSIIETGFLKLDPIIAVKEGGYYRVVEGNRRLSAIITIHGHIKRKALEVSESIMQSISEIEIVKLREDCDESTIWMLQGIRHVSGIRDWGPFQQAELIKTLHEVKKMTYKQIGSVIGLSPARVATILKAYCGLSQMMKNDKWSSYATPELFSHFEQAYVRAPVREWLGWDKENSTFCDNENLELFYKWIVCNDPSIPREKMKSRDVRDKLPFILDNPEAKELMISDEVSVDEAYSVVLTGNKYRQEFEATSERLLKCLDRMKKSFKLSDKEKNILHNIQDYISEIV